MKVVWGRIIKIEFNVTTFNRESLIVANKKAHGEKTISFKDSL